MKYRLYIDEVGNSHLGSSHNPNQRYLSLTGIIIKLEYVEEHLYPDIENLKRKYFNSHPDDPVIFHRKELVNKKPPFSALQDLDTAKSFDKELLRLLTRWEYIVITVVIDKLQHSQQYQIWRFDPYHYCLKVLVERYVLWFKEKISVGDVMAESRGGKEDRRLKDSFTRVYNEGSEWVRPDTIHQHLTSRQLKVKSKKNNIAGLQLADIIAHPSFRSALARRNNEALPTTFGGKIAEILEDFKFYRDKNGRIRGWGRKWLP